MDDSPQENLPKVDSPNNRLDQPESLAPDDSIVWGQLPASLRVLFISNSCSFSSELINGLNASSLCEVEVETVDSILAGLGMLRDRTFDVVVMGVEDGLTADRPDIDLGVELGSIRTSCSTVQPVIVLGTIPSQAIVVECFQSGADAYLDLTATTVTHLIWQLARSSERQKLLAENQRLNQHRVQQVVREADEATTRWKEQSAMAVIQTSCSEHGGSGDSREFDANLMGYYREVLQTQIIMGSGNLSDEVSRLGGLLVDERMTADAVLRMHLAIVKDMIHELGNRSARHVMNRADALVIDLLRQVAEGYRQSGKPNVQQPARIPRPEMS